MAKPELRDHRKFLKLKRLLGQPTPHVIGYLDCLWHRGYQTGSAFIGDALDVEAAAEFPGEQGAFARAAHESGFIDRDEAGNFSIHDLYDHAPTYARKRMQRRGTAPEDCHTDAKTHKSRPRGEENGKKPPERHTEPRADSQEPKTKSQDTTPPPPASEESPHVSPSEFMAAWNDAATANGWHACQKMTPDRTESLRQRQRDPFWRAHWRPALIRASPIPGLRGNNPRQWRADVDWFLRPKTVPKISEGKYDEWGSETKARARAYTNARDEEFERVLNDFGKDHAP